MFKLSFITILHSNEYHSINIVIYFYIIYIQFIVQFIWIIKKYNIIYTLRYTLYRE